MYYNKPTPPNKTTSVRYNIYLDNCSKAELFEWLNKVPVNTEPDFDRSDSELYYSVEEVNTKYNEQYAKYEQDLEVWNKRQEAEKEKKQTTESKLMTLLTREPEIINMLLKKHKIT